MFSPEFRRQKLQLLLKGSYLPEEPEDFSMDDFLQQMSADVEAEVHSPNDGAMGSGINDSEPEIRAVERLQGCSRVAGRPDLPEPQDAQQISPLGGARPGPGQKSSALPRAGGQKGA